MSLPSIQERALAVLGNRQWTSNWTLDGRSVYGEIMELATLKIWLCQQAVTPEEYEALQVPTGFIKSGLGKAEHDAAFFRRAPGATENGQLATMVVDGRTFAQVAIPGEMEPGFSEVLVLAVDKHHSVMFAAGRTIEILDCGDGMAYVPQVSDVVGLPGMTRQNERVLPDGWSINKVTLKHDLFLEIPNPARVSFFFSGHSFQGPVKIDLD